MIVDPQKRRFLSLENHTGLTYGRTEHLIEKKRKGKRKRKEKIRRRLRRMKEYRLISSSPSALIKEEAPDSPLTRTPYPQYIVRTIPPSQLPPFHYIMIMVCIHTEGVAQLNKRTMRQYYLLRKYIRNLRKKLTRK